MMKTFPVRNLSHTINAKNSVQEMDSEEHQRLLGTPDQLLTAITG